MAAREPSTLWWSTPEMSSTRSAQIRRHSFSSSMPPRRYSQVTPTTASLAELAGQSRFAHSDNEDQGRWLATKRQLPPPEVQRSGRLRGNLDGQHSSRHHRTNVTVWVLSPASQQFGLTCGLHGIVNERRATSAFDRRSPASDVPKGI